MEELKNSYSFLVIGGTQESTETQGFKRYVGLASSKVLAVNPNKKQLDELMGFESANEPEYVVDTDNGKEARITFIVRTDPEANNGIEITNRLMFTLRSAAAYNKDQTKVQVIDEYGDFVWADTEDVKNHKKLMTANGTEMRISTNYRIACVGECALVDFLKNFLCVKSAYEYKNGVWVRKPEAQAAEGKFTLEHIKDYFKGDFSELREALAYQPNNKVKLLYGVRTTDDNKQYQTICTREQFFLRNNANATAEERLAKRLADSKANGSFATTEYKVQPLTEYTIQPTPLENVPTASEDTGSDLPWE